MLSSRRQRRVQGSRRGQGAALWTLLAWAALTALFAAAVPAWQSASVVATPAHGSAVPLAAPGGGERDNATHRRATAKLRRPTAQPALPDAAAPVVPTRSLLQLLAATGVLMPTPPLEAAPCWASLHAAPPCRDLPGRRQQRGQAPPLA